MPANTLAALAALLALGAGAVLTAPQPALAQDAEAEAPEDAAPEAPSTEEAPAEAPAAEAPAAEEPAADDAAAAAETAAADPAAIPDMVLGDPDAPVTMIEYASFTCPHCAAFHADQFQRLKADYIDTGRVRFVYREVYFDRFGLWASMIARCGGEMRFFGISDMIYDEQREWTGDGDPAAIAENLRRIGRTAGMDDATLDACLRDEDQARALLAWYEANAEADGITSTPTLVIDGEAHPNMSYEELSALLDAALAE